MARTIKVYGTNTFIYGELFEEAKKRGLSENRHQVRIICGATSMAEANRLCEAAGLSEKTFISGYTSVTGNSKELALAGNGGIFIAMGVLSNDYYSIEELQGRT